MRKSILTLIVANILSKPIGLLRQVVFATFYGVTAAMSACRFSQTITLVFMNFFTTDTLNAGFLPLYERYKRDSFERAQCFFWYLTGLLLVLSMLIIWILYNGAPFIIHWFAPGFEGNIVLQTEQFIRVFALAVPFCLLGTLLSYLAMSDGSYVGVGARPIIESIGLIVGVLLSVWRHEVVDIAWGFVVAYLFFFSMVFFICLRRHLLHWVHLTTLKQNATLMRSDFWQAVRPLLILPLFMQGKFVTEKLVASLMAVSVVAAVDYARFVVETGINILATPIGLLGLSFFSVLDEKKLAEKIEIVVTLLLSISLPMTLFLIINNQMIISVLYEYGAFNADAVYEASDVLLGMAYAFFAQIIGYVLLKILSARLQNKRVMHYLVFALLCNIIFNFLFYRLLGPICLGLGESLYAFIIFILCINHFKLLPLLQQLFLFLAPTGLIYAGCAFYLSNNFAMSRWMGLMMQLSFFSIYWGMMLMGYKRTRILLLAGVFAK